jgi:hypothetical protein
MKKLKIGLAVAALALSGVFLAAAPANATDYGVNMNAACQLQGQSSAYLAVNNVNGWRCSPSGGGVNVTNYCQYTYGSSATAIYTNFNDPYSWRCRV